MRPEGIFSLLQRQEISEDLVQACCVHSLCRAPPIFPTNTKSALSNFSFRGEVVSSATSYAPDPYAVSKVEAGSYYAGLPS